MILFAGAWMLKPPLFFTSHVDNPGPAAILLASLTMFEAALPKTPSIVAEERETPSARCDSMSNFELELFSRLVQLWL